VDLPAGAELSGHGLGHKALTVADAVRLGQDRGRRGEFGRRRGRLLPHGRGLEQLHAEDLQRLQIIFIQMIEGRILLSLVLAVRQRILPHRDGDVLQQRVDERAGRRRLRPAQGCVGELGQGELRDIHSVVAQNVLAGRVVLDRIECRAVSDLRRHALRFPDHEQLPLALVTRGRGLGLHPCEHLPRDECGQFFQFLLIHRLTSKSARWCFCPPSKRWPRQSRCAWQEKSSVSPARARRSA